MRAPSGAHLHLTGREALTAARPPAPEAPGARTMRLVQRAGGSTAKDEMEKRVTFKGWVLPLLLIAPQAIISAVFFFYPAGQAVWQSQPP